MYMLAPILAPSQFLHWAFYFTQCRHWENSSTFWHHAKMGTQCWHWVPRSRTGCLTLTLYLTLNDHAMVVPQWGRICQALSLGLCNVPVPELGWCQVGPQHIYFKLQYFNYIILLFKSTCFDFDSDTPFVACVMQGIHFLHENLSAI